MLPDAKLAFEIVDGYFASDEPGAITDAWEILKADVLAQQTNNKQSTPFPKMEGERIMRESGKCPVCGSYSQC